MFLTYIKNYIITVKLIKSIIISIELGEINKDYILISIKDDELNEYETSIFIDDDINLPSCIDTINKLEPTKLILDNLD